MFRERYECGSGSHHGWPRAAESSANALYLFIFQVTFPVHRACPIGPVCPQPPHLLLPLPPDCPSGDAISCTVTDAGRTLDGRWAASLAYAMPRHPSRHLCKNEAGDKICRRAPLAICPHNAHPQPKKGLPSGPFNMTPSRQVHFT